MKDSKQLFDPSSKILYTLDYKAMSFRVEEEGKAKREARLKPFHLAILWYLFEHHPQPIRYDTLEKYLKNYKLACPDSTRLHRKISEIRRFLAKLHPSLDEAIQNSRGIGYSLPLIWKEPNANGQIQPLKLKNEELDNILKKIWKLIQESIAMTSLATVVRYEEKFILDRRNFKHQLETIINVFNGLEADLLQELRTQPSDFVTIRIQYLMAKLRIYIGLARTSDYSISIAQWHDWHRQEVDGVFADLQALVKLVDQ